MPWRRCSSSLSLPLLRRQATREDDPSVYRFLVTALVVKLAGAFVRYYAFVLFYGGLNDASVYSKFGVQIADNFRHGDFTTGLNSLTGTNFVRFLTGCGLYGDRSVQAGGCVVFSWLGFWGLFLFYRAFTIAVPEGRRRSFGYLLFFLPSLVVWPSSIGKDAWMMFAMGLAAYGVARLAHSMVGRRDRCRCRGPLARLARPAARRRIHGDRVRCCARHCGRCGASIVSSLPW